MRYVIAHDLGTTGNKATLFDEEGRLISSAFQAYETFYDHVGWAEQDANAWWRAVCDSTRLLLQKAEVQKEDVAALSFSGQMMGCVALDKEAKPIRNAIIWADQRAVKQEEALSKRISPDTIFERTGHRLSASYSLCKLLWLRDNEAEAYRQTHAFVHAKDAMIARLTGVFATEPSDASGMNLYNLQEGSFDASIIDAAELDEQKLPQVLASTEVVGEVMTSVADELGLKAGTAVVMGGGDGCCAALGAGVIKEGRAYNYVGSSSWIAIASRRAAQDKLQKTFTWAHVIPDMLSPCGTMQAAGASYQWAKEQLGETELQKAEALKQDVYELLNDLASSSPTGAKGLFYLPYLMGERSPRWNSQARASFIGLTIQHTKADMIRSVLEGVTMNLRVILQLLSRENKIDSMRVIGGGAKGRFWNKLMADMYNMPVERLTYLDEATSMGAAVLAGVGVGLYDDFSIIETMNPIQESFYPDSSAASFYEGHYELFEKLYEALEPLFPEFASL